MFALIRPPTLHAPRHNSNKLICRHLQAPRRLLISLPEARLKVYFSTYLTSGSNFCYKV
nr:MAG TPA: hypothetical protein [Caudoviricetes sp.]